MGTSRRLATVRAGAVAAAVVGSAVLAIGGAAARTPAHRASTITLSTEKTKNLGTVIDVSGRSVYLSAKDKNGTSSCTGKCATAWPPLVSTGAVRVASGSGLNPRLVGKVKRADGRTQVTYNHHPLYYYSKDATHTHNGENKDAFGSRWYLVSAKGKAVKPKRRCPPGWTPTPTGCLPGSYG